MMSAIIQGGATANKNGKFFERKVVQLLLGKGFLHIDGLQKRKILKGKLSSVNGGLPWVSQQVGGRYKNMYGGNMIVDLIGYHPKLPEGFVIEMKTQNTAGSVDEKYAFTTISLKGLKPLTVIVYEGEGAKPEAVKWMRAQTDDNHLMMNFFGTSNWLDELFD